MSVSIITGKIGSGKTSGVLQQEVIPVLIQATEWIKAVNEEKLIDSGQLPPRSPWRSFVVALKRFLGILPDPSKALPRRVVTNIHLKLDKIASDFGVSVEDLKRCCIVLEGADVQYLFGRPVPVLNADGSPRMEQGKRGQLHPVYETNDIGGFVYVPGSCPLREGDLVVLDEMAVYWGSAREADLKKKGVDVETFLNQHRKLIIDLVFITQNGRSLPFSIRDNCSRFVIAENLKHAGLISPDEAQNEPQILVDTVGDFPRPGLEIIWKIWGFFNPTGAGPYRHITFKHSPEVFSWYDSFAKHDLGIDIEPNEEAESYDKAPSGFYAGAVWRWFRTVYPRLVYYGCCAALFVLFFGLFFPSCRNVWGQGAKKANKPSRVAAGVSSPGSPVAGAVAPAPPAPPPDPALFQASDLFFYDSVRGILILKDGRQYSMPRDFVISDDSKSLRFKGQWLFAPVHFPKFPSYSYGYPLRSLVSLLGYASPPDSLPDIPHSGPVSIELLSSLYGLEFDDVSSICRSGGR